MGAGTGIQVLTCKKLGFKNITAVDINKKAVKELKKQKAKNNIKIIHSDLFKKIRKKQKFDLIIFNPPYLPIHKYDKKPDTTGGKLGNETINRFLKQAKHFLAEKGVILLLTSSLTKKINFLDYKKRKIASKNMFFEKLYVWELNR